MKRKIFTLIFMFAAIASYAQTVVTVSGYVLNIANGNPVQLQQVSFSADSTMNTNGFYYYGQVYTDVNGFYTDTIPLNDSLGGYFTQGTLMAGTYDCNNLYTDTLVSFTTGIYYLTANFNICVSVSCVASFSSNPDSTNTFDFFDNSNGNINTWHWDFGDGTTSSLQNPVHTFPNSGFFYVCLTVSNVDIYGNVICTNSYCLNTNVNVPSTNDNYCDADFDSNQSYPATFNFTNYSFANEDGIDAIVNQTWDFGDGTISNVQSPSHTYTLPGIYLVNLTIYTTEGCSSYLEMPVEADTVLDGSCHADFEVYIDYSLPLTFYFQESSLDENFSQVISSYLWNFGDGSTSTVMSPTHTFTQGVYHICHTITTITGCTSTYCENLVVDSACNMYVITNSIINESVVGAADGAITISVVGTPSFIFNWSNGATTQNISGLTAGYYNVWVTDSTGCQTWATFDILEFADISNSNNGGTLITNIIDSCFNYQLAYANVYSYEFQGSNTVDVTWIVYNITHTLHGFINTAYVYDTTGFYYVLLTVSCAKNIYHFSDKIYIRIDAAIISPPADISRENVMLYPVPAAGKLNISFTLPKPDVVTIKILNITGQVIQSENVIYNGGQKVLVLNTSELSGGLYFVQINYKENKLVRKFVK
ncbi:MAG: PKD domain-containing protein [Bacteroidia bacterium]|nr:PKD domain-containing protein [Bacteroidia bacterium]